MGFPAIGEYPRYVMVNTRNGYLGMSFDPNRPPDAIGFTKDISWALTLNNFDEVKSLCDRYMATAYIKYSEGDKYKKCYEPKNVMNMDIIDEIRRDFRKRH